MSFAIFCKDLNDNFLHLSKIADSESALVTIDNCTSTQAYGLVFECIMSKELLKENGCEF